MLELCRQLFERFAASGIRYCHWKSCAHIAAGLDGDTDLDVLVDRGQHRMINEILFSCGFQRFETREYLKYVSIEDFIGIDKQSNKLVHIHLHYELRLGKRHIKEYHLPFEKLALDHSIVDTSTGIYVIDPCLEIVLLLLRYVIKGGHGRLFGVQDSVLSKEYLDEFSWLCERISLDRVSWFAGQLFGNRYASAVVDFIHHSGDIDSFRRLRKATIEVVRDYATMSGFSQRVGHTLGCFKILYNYVRLKKLHRPIPYRRVSPLGGRVIAFIGVDGSGKSTLVREVERWLGQKIDIYPLYFGSGHGRGSLIRYPLVVLSYLAKRAGRIGSRASGGEKLTSRWVGKTSRLYRLFMPIWAVTLALEKRDKFIRLWSARSKGMVVVCDRYPQTDVPGFSDGPLLHQWIGSTSVVKRRVAEWEYSIYGLCRVYRPDLVVRLRVPEEVSRERKPDTSRSMVAKKIRAMDSISFGPDTRVVDVDTSGSISVSLDRIKRLIAELLV